MFICMISWMIRPPCEITDQLAVGTQNCFSTLFYTPYTNIKTSAIMHQNAPLPDKKIKKISGEGAQPGGYAASPEIFFPRPLPHCGEGYPLPRPHSLGAFGASTGVPVPFHLRLEHCIYDICFRYRQWDRLKWPPKVTQGHRQFYRFLDILNIL